jgi:hypothetical protein
VLEVASGILLLTDLAQRLRGGFEQRLKGSFAFAFLSRFFTLEKRLLLLG